MLKLYTAQLYKINQSDPFVLNITRGSAKTKFGKKLAPTHALYRGHKFYNGDMRFKNYEPLSDEQYTERYYALLRPRYGANKELFHDALRQEKLILCCYCAKGKFCHRHLAVDILSIIAQSQNIPIQICGEI